MNNIFHKLTPQEISCLIEIGYYFLDKTKKDSIPFSSENYKNCYKELDSLKIKNILLEDTILHIELDRPGLFIGKHGIQIKQIEMNLSNLLKKPISINVVESNLENYLYPYLLF